MRKLTTSESRLLIFFCSAIFVALNLFAVRAWTGARASLVRDAEAARARISESQMWVDGASGLASAHEWIQAHPPQTNTAEEAKLSGPFSGVAKFLFAIQSPTAWRSVPKLTIRSDTEPPNVLVDMEVHQYYLLPAPPSGP